MLARRLFALVLPLAVHLVAIAPLMAQHHPGERCISCHSSFALGATVFGDDNASAVFGDAPLILRTSTGGVVHLGNSDAEGRIFAPTLDSGRYLIELASLRSRTWHLLPEQRDCNACHIAGGNANASRNLKLGSLHTELPVDNACTHCHHYPASMELSRLATTGTLNARAQRPATQGSAVVIRGNTYAFDPSAYSISTTRPDMFAEGYFSLFDVLLAVAKRNGHSLSWHWDASCQTHFIDSVDGVAGNFWYHFSYDAGSGTATELRNRRQIRWDELLYQPGAWVQLVMGENLDELRAEFREEIEREQQYGHRIPQVQININPGDFQGNPPESHRISVTRNYRDVQVAAHNLRASGGDTLYRAPFRPGVVTAIDVLLSLRDQGELDVVGNAYFTHLAGKVMESFRVRSIGIPGVGLAHASGRQGFVYTTGNGTPTRLANDADRKQHVHADIHVIHAPDFALWRWIELGNPYYEADSPTGVAEMLADNDARDLGFRVQQPWPQPAQGVVHLSCNMFEEGHYRMDILDLHGRRLSTLMDARTESIGVQRFQWVAPTAGVYFVRVSNGRHSMLQKFLISSGR